MTNNDYSADEILNRVFDEFEHKKQKQKDEREREKEMCNLLIEQIKSEKTFEANIQLLDRFLTPEGQTFISKMTKGREEIRNALLANIEQLEKRMIEGQENAQFIKSALLFKDKLKEINRIYYNSFEYMSYLILS